MVGKAIRYTNEIYSYFKEERDLKRYMYVVHKVFIKREKREKED